jgi:hypothetical protein
MSELLETRAVEGTPVAPSEMSQLYPVLMRDHVKVWRPGITVLVSRLQFAPDRNQNSIHVTSLTFQYLRSFTIKKHEV